MSNTITYKEPIHIPARIKKQMQEKAQQYGREDWFRKAWVKYIGVCRNADSANDIPDADVFFEQESLRNGVKFSEDDTNSMYAADLDSEEEEGSEDDDLFEEDLDEDYEEL